MDKAKLFLETFNNPTGFQAKDFGFCVGYTAEGFWRLVLISRKDRAWDVERVISLPCPYRAALGARKALGRVLSFAYNQEKIDKKLEDALVRDLNLLIAEFYEGKEISCDMLFDATAEELSFLSGLEGFCNASCE